MRVTVWPRCRATATASWHRSSKSYRRDSALVSSSHSLRWDGREFPLREGVTVIGRAEDADLRISLPSLSRHHARIVVRDLEATLEDLGSRHGSWRGAAPVEGVVRLASGDEIRLGTASLIYCLAMPDDTTQD